MGQSLAAVVVSRGGHTRFEQDLLRLDLKRSLEEGKQAYLMTTTKFSIYLS